jgi:hypothetical protein
MFAAMTSQAGGSQRQDDGKAIKRLYYLPTASQLNHASGTLTIPLVTGHHDCCLWPSREFKAGNSLL